MVPILSRKFLRFEPRGPNLATSSHMPRNIHTLGPSLSARHYSLQKESPAFWLGILGGQSPELDTPLLWQVGDSQQLGGPHGPPRRGDYNSQRPRHAPLCLAILPAQPCNLMQSASFCPICALPHLPPEPCLQHVSARAASR